MYYNEHIQYFNTRFLNKPCVYVENKNTIFKNRQQEHLVIVKEIKEEKNGVTFVFSFCETLEKHKIFIPRSFLEKESPGEIGIIYAATDRKEDIKETEKERKQVLDSIEDPNLLFYSLDSVEVFSLSDFPENSLTYVGWFWADDFSEVNGILKAKDAPCRCIFRAPENRYFVCYQTRDMEKRINKLVYGINYLSYD